MRTVFTYTFIVITMLLQLSCNEKQQPSHPKIDKLKTSISQAQDSTSSLSEKKKKIELSPGQQLMSKSDCGVCHLENTKLVGPSYLDISDKYDNSKSNIDKLIKSVSNGQTGTWGNVAMPGHPSLSKKDVQQMIEYILSVGKQEKS